ncbi:MAG: RcnB family protein [Gammaproteobacteria bacterium]|nr:RcnB family protein [Gammaproteobacteria bacterium]
MFMKSILRTLTVTSTALLIATGSAYAEKPGKGNGNQGKNKEQSEQRGQKENRKGGGNEKGNRADGGRDSGQGGVSVSFNFGSAETRIVRDYYGGQVAKGKCPPGLAKKGNGCQPPGQAKQWQKGRALGSDVRYYDIPNELRIRLPAPPLNHKYVQLGTDLLLIAVGTAIVVDAVDGIF